MTMIDIELERKTRQRAHEMWVIEGRPVGAADRHWLAAEREVADEVHSAAVCRWTAPVKGTHVEACVAAAAEREATKQAQSAERELVEEVHSAAICRWTAPVEGTYASEHAKAAAEREAAQQAHNAAVSR